MSTITKTMSKSLIISSFLIRPSYIQAQAQVRSMSVVKTRHTHPRYVWPKKKRERHDQELTQDNTSFIKQVIHDQYGPAYVMDGGTGMPYVSPLKEILRPRTECQPRSVRTGLIARKIGIYPMWDKDGNRCLATLLQVVDNHVVRYISPEQCQQNYGSRFKRCGLHIVGAESADPTIFTKEYCGLFTESAVMPKIKLTRFLVSPEAALPLGTPLYATHFQVGQYVDISGKTIDHGFQGVVKRWGFKGQPSTHGTTKSERRGGNTGGGGEKGRIWPGTKLPGHMGDQYITIRGYKILRINTKYNVIYIKGPNIPGETNSFVSIRDTALRHRERPTSVPFPTHYPDEEPEPLPEDIFDPKMHNYSEPTIMFEEKR